MPDFAQVYGFIGSVFDPTATDHLKKLRKMEPINVETVGSIFTLWTWMDLLPFLANFNNSI